VQAGRQIGRTIWQYTQAVNGATRQVPGRTVVGRWQNTPRQNLAGAGV